MKEKIYPIMPIDEMIQEYGVMPIESDPLGSYTGIPKVKDEKPVQDADDL